MNRILLTAALVLASAAAGAQQFGNTPDAHEQARRIRMSADRLEDAGHYREAARWRVQAERVEAKEPLLPDPIEVEIHVTHEPTPGAIVVPR